MIAPMVRDMALLVWSKASSTLGGCFQPVPWGWLSPILSAVGDGAAWVFSDTSFPCPPHPLHLHPFQGLWLVLRRQWAGQC